MSKKNITKKIVLNNRKYFENLLKEIYETSDINDKIEKAKIAIKFAIDNSTGYYSSDIIEKIFIDISNNINVENLDDKYEENSIIHVMTESCYAGGHTRVVERWVELSDNNEKHSLIFTEKENQEVPIRLLTAIKEKGGEVIFLKDSMSDIEKAIELRKIASKYKYVVLHIHMHDVIPLIAFGNIQFKRPIIFFNHADHLFWVGVSIADIVADIKEKGQKITLERRKANKSFMLSVPVDLKIENKINKETARKNLDLPLNDKIIISIGRNEKFKPVLGINFMNFVKKFFKKDKNSIIIVIGINDKIFSKWEKISKKSKGRFKIVGLIPHEQLKEYIFASDLIIDSIPLGGGTSILDAISCNRPVLTTNNPIGQFDYLLKSDAYCESIDNLVEKSLKIINNSKYEEKNIESVKSSLKELNEAESWKNNLKHLYNNTPKEHRIHNFNITQKDNPITFTEIFLQNNNQISQKPKNRKFYIPYLIEIIKDKNIEKNKKIFKIKIFGKLFCFSRKIK